MLLKADYTIIQTPDRVTLQCPYCEDEIEMNISEFEVHCKDIFEASGDTIECDGCKADIELGNWELD